MTTAKPVLYPQAILSLLSPPTPPFSFNKPIGFGSSMATSSLPSLPLFSLSLSSPHMSGRMLTVAAGDRSGHGWSQRFLLPAAAALAASFALVGGGYPSSTPAGDGVGFVTLAAAVAARQCGHGYTCPGDTSMCVRGVDACECTSKEETGWYGPNCDQWSGCPYVTVNGTCYDENRCWNSPVGPSDTFYNTCCPTSTRANQACSSHGFCVGFGTTTPRCLCDAGYVGRGCRPTTLTRSLAVTRTVARPMTLTINLPHTRTRALPITRTSPLTVSRWGGSRTRSSPMSHSAALTRTVGGTRTRALLMTRSVAITRSKSRNTRTRSATVPYVPTTCYMPSNDTRSVVESAIAALRAGTPLADRAQSYGARRVQEYIAASVNKGSSYSIGQCVLCGVLAALTVLGLGLSSPLALFGLHSSSTTIGGWHVDARGHRITMSDEEAMRRAVARLQRAEAKRLRRAEKAEARQQQHQQHQYRQAREPFFPLSPPLLQLCAPPRVSPSPSPSLHQHQLYHLSGRNSVSAMSGSMGSGVAMPPRQHHRQQHHLHHQHGGIDFAAMAQMIVNDRVGRRKSSSHA